MRLLIIVFVLAWQAAIRVGCAQEPTDNAKRQHPNIILIVSDDHARAAVSAYGSRLLEIPNIDCIASEGVLFANAFVTNAICGPSRAMMLTGKYSHMNGFRDNGQQFDGSQQTFPKILQTSGYQTMFVGKWHLGTEPQGFDYWCILPGQGVYYNPRFIQMGDTIRREGYVTDLITDIAIDALQKRDTSKPFCLLYNHKAPHRNWMPDA